MDPRLQRRVQRYGWDRARDHYEMFWREQLDPAQTLLLKLADLKPGEKVLDVACGTGLVTLPAAEAVGPEGAVVGTDLSERMVERLEETAARHDLQHIESRRMDAEGLDLANDSFDVALCALGLMYVPDPHNAMVEMHRVLKTNGRAVVAVWGERQRCGWAEIFPIVDSRVKTQVCPLFFQLGAGNSLQKLVENAGYEDVRVERICTTLFYDSAEDALGAAFSGGPVALAYSRFDDRTRKEAHSEYLESIEPYRKEKKYEIPGEFVIAWGRAGDTA